MNPTTNPTEIPEVESPPEVDPRAQRLALFKERRREADRLRKAAWRAKTGNH
ncbi:MAG: hypothetical protein O3C27_15400 [Actinomycetota bacterium]|nr:hypothetical protein [Actinomycetota bacterium]